MVRLQLLVVTHLPVISMLLWVLLLQLMPAALQLSLQVMVVLAATIAAVLKQEHGLQEMLAVILLLHHVQ